jgi:hypothetical protein
MLAMAGPMNDTCRLVTIHGERTFPTDSMLKGNLQRL